MSGRRAPFDLDGAPRFAWHVSSPEQSAYEVRVASSRQRALLARGDVWESGKVRSAEQLGVPFGGAPLEPSEHYYWRLRTWDEHGRVSPWSAVASFGTGPGAHWDASEPIWASSPAERWEDYVLTARVTIDQVALGLRFRAPDPSGGYMWQLRGGDNRLVPHVIEQGRFSILESVALPPGTLALGREVTVEIRAEGARISTSIDGVVVHTLQDARFLRGGIGVRTGNSESGRVHSLSVRQVDGPPLLETTGGAGDRTFGCTQDAPDGRLVPRSAHCLSAGMSVDWAFLRREFALKDSPIAWATLHATATSPVRARQYVYKAYVNGRFAGAGPAQSLGSERRYDGFDVAALLRPGTDNAIGVQAYATDGQAFQAELTIAYADGTRETIGTDESWSGLSGDWSLPAAGSIGTSYYSAPRENLDLRYFPQGFSEPGFSAPGFSAPGVVTADDLAGGVGWSPVTRKAASGELRASPLAKLAELRGEPVAIVEKGPGHYLVDFGKTWLGGVELSFERGAAEMPVELRFGEVIESDTGPDAPPGAPTLTPTPSEHASVRYQLHAGNTYRDVLSLRDGAQTLQTWGLRVFRYLEVIGAPEPVTRHNLRALALVYPFDEGELGEFESSDPALERVWQLSQQTLLALTHNFLVDSWTRERAPYEADAYLHLRSLLAIASDAAVGRYTFDYLLEHRTWPTEWPLYTILGVHAAWLHTGDREQLGRAYPELLSKLPERWFDESTGLIRKPTGADGCASTMDCDLVDWPAVERDGFVFSEHSTVLNALSVRAYRALAAIATELGKGEEAAWLEERARTIGEAVQQWLYVPELGRFDDGMSATLELTGHSSQHASAFALAAGIASPDTAPGIAEYVASRGMACSVYGAAHVLEGLFRAGWAPAALDLLGGGGLRSWEHMLELGAGATAEAWDPSIKPNLSFSHPWAASPAYLIPMGLFGIEPISPGYERFVVAPPIDSLPAARLVLPTVRGPIRAAFKRTRRGAPVFALRVPNNARAFVRLPRSEQVHTWFLDGRLVRFAPGREMDGAAGGVEVGAGCHSLTASRGDHAAQIAALRVCDHDVAPSGGRSTRGVPAD